MPFHFKVADSTWDILREEGAIIEEADDDGEDNGVEGFNEKDALAEKVGLHLQEIGVGLGVEDMGDGGDVMRKEQASRGGYSDVDPSLLR